MATTTRKTNETHTDETPADRFKRLAQARVTKALTSISLLSQLANRGRYEYTDEQVDRIEATLKSQLDVAVRALRDGKVPRGTEFVL